ncbi:hypothetical protein PMAYCL1PPCAC_14850, partial [Pristionchus mayeri]
GPTVNGRQLYITSTIMQRISLSLLAIFDCLDVLLVICAFLRSSKLYNKSFAKSTLGTRYQVKEVSSLTRVLIPVCCSSLIVRFTVIVLAYFAFGNERVIDLLFTIIRFCCTAEAIIESIVLLSRHRLLRRRVTQMLGLPMREVKVAIERDPEAIADVYFDIFNQGMEAK